jgi:hypothetical protein
MYAKQLETLDIVELVLLLQPKTRGRVAALLV